MGEILGDKQVYKSVASLLTSRFEACNNCQNNRQGKNGRKAKNKAANRLI